MKGNKTKPVSFHVLKAMITLIAFGLVGPGVYFYGYFYVNIRSMLSHCLDVARLFKVLRRHPRSVMPMTEAAYYSFPLLLSPCVRWVIYNKFYMLLYLDRPEMDEMFHDLLCSNFNKSPISFPSFWNFSIPWFRGAGLISPYSLYLLSIR